MALRSALATAPPIGATTAGPGLFTTITAGGIAGNDVPKKDAINVPPVVLHTAMIMEADPHAWRKDAISSLHHMVAVRPIDL